MAIALKLLAFFGSTAGKYLLIAVAAGTFLYGVRESGYNAAMRKCEAAALRAKLEATRVDLQAATDAAADRERALQDSEARMSAAEAQLKRIEDDAKRRPVAGCLATDDDVRLRERSGRGSR